MNVVCTNIYYKLSCCQMLFQKAFISQRADGSSRKSKCFRQLFPDIHDDGIPDYKRHWSQGLRGWTATCWEGELRKSALLRTLGKDSSGGTLPGQMRPRVESPKMNSPFLHTILSKHWICCCGYTLPYSQSSRIKQTWEITNSKTMRSAHGSEELSLVAGDQIKSNNTTNQVVCRTVMSSVQGTLNKDIQQHRRMLVSTDI